MQSGVFDVFSVVLAFMTFLWQLVELTTIYFMGFIGRQTEPIN